MILYYDLHSSRSLLLCSDGAGGSVVGDGDADERSLAVKVNGFIELFCVLLGHDWTESGKHTRGGVTLEEWRKCGKCGLEIHDRSGTIKEYERVYGLK